MRPSDKSIQPDVDHGKPIGDKAATVDVYRLGARQASSRDPKPERFRERRESRDTDGDAAVGPTSHLPNNLTVVLDFGAITHSLLENGAMMR